MFLSAVIVGCALLEPAKDRVMFLSAHPDDITAVAEEKMRLIRLYECQNAEDGMCKEEMRNSRNRAIRMWPFRCDGYAEAFAPFGGCAQGPCVFTEIPRPGKGGGFCGDRPRTRCLF